MKITVLIEDDGDGLRKGDPPRFAFSRTMTPGVGNPRFRAQTFREKAIKAVDEIAGELETLYGASPEFEQR